MCRWIVRALTIVAGCVPALAPAQANDSTAALAAGGLQLTKTAEIEMRQEDLFVSMTEIRVRYRFFNRSGQDVTTLVAFPLPEIASGEDVNLILPEEEDPNFVAFQVSVDGKPVVPRLEQKAFAEGRDQSALLSSLGVPLLPRGETVRTALDKLPRERWLELARLGLGEIEEYDTGEGMKPHFTPRWSVKTTYFWEQRFPAGREIAVEHRYRPVVGYSMGTSVGVAGTDPDSVAEQKSFAAAYCTDKSFVDGVAQLKKKAGDENVREARIGYILTTGANWAGPIKDFRLVVDKGDAARLVSFCGEGVRKIAPTRFEMRKSDFVPAKDLSVVFVGEKILPP